VTGNAQTANTALAALINAAGCSHAGLARRINALGASRGLRLGYDKTAVSHWLSGTQPRPAIRYLISDALSEKLDRPVTLAELGFVEPEAPSCVTNGLIFQAEVEPTIDTLMGLAQMDIDRRALLKLVPFMGSALIAPQRDWLLNIIELPAQRSASLSPDEPAAALYAMGRVFDEMDNRFGGGHARLALLSYLRDHVAEQLHRSLPDEQRRNLFSAAAQLTATAGWMTYDSGDLGLAQRYMIQGLRLGSEGGDRDISGQIFAGLSHLATHAGSPSEALNLARVGIATAAGTRSQLGLMRLHAMKARAHAALGDKRAAARAISDAELALDRSRDSDDVPDSVRFLDPPYLAAETAACLLEMKDYQNAARFASQAAGGTNQLGRRHTISLAVLASAQLEPANPQVEAAVTIAGRALQGLGKISSHRSISALNDFRRRLAPYHTERAVRDFDRLASARLDPITGAANSRPDPGRSGPRQRGATRR
jgi:hypothetical protein